MTPKEKLDRAECALMMDEPFFACLLGRLNLVQDDSINPPTMCTDGKRIRWHSKFVQAHSIDELKTVIVHEIMHCAFLHHIRRGERHPVKWNFATDYSINNELEALNDEARKKNNCIPFPLPKGCLLNPAFKNDTEETIYDKLPDFDGGSDGNGEGSSMGEVEDSPGDAAEAKAQEAEWKVAVTQAAVIAQKQGKLPQRIARLVDELLNPPPRWQDLFRNFFRELCKDDYSWKRPNARYMGTGFFLPSLRSHRLGKIAVAIDTSGSIDGPLLAEFMAELEGICREVKPSGIILMDCDAALHSVREYEPNDILPREFKGGGGTSFCPPVEYLTEQNEDICCLVYFTDLYGDFPGEPDFPVFWATKSENMQAPYGVTVYLG